MSQAGLDSRVSDTIERRKASRDWMRDNFWGEFEEVWRYMKCRTVPIIDPKTGKEDTTRTNICMPDFWTVVRRKTARLTARPPALRIHAKSPQVAEWWTGFAAYQWDRAHEQVVQRRHVLQAQLFGLSVKAHWYDTVIENRRFRRKTEDVLAEIGVVMDDETGKLHLPSVDEIQTKRTRPYKDFPPQQTQELMASVGPEMFRREAIRKYEGPVSSFVFLGDFYPEPEFESLHSAAWIILEAMRDVEWLAYFAKQNYSDPRDPQAPERPIFGTKRLQELLDGASYSTTSAAKDEDLKAQLRSAIFKTEPLVDVKLLPVKRFKITSEYVFKDGWPHVRWIGNDKHLLNYTESDKDDGYMPLPWDLNGRYNLSSFTPIPDLLWGVGDSSPRILRHLMRLHNVTVGQRTDLVTAALMPLVPIREGADIPQQIQNRGCMRVFRVKTPGDIGTPITVQVPREAWESEKAILMQMQNAEPSLNSFGVESQAVPGASQVATLGMLQQRAGEALSADELERLNESLAEETTIKLLMAQQGLSEIPKIPKQFMPAPEAEADSSMMTLASGAPGERAAVTIKDPLELQEDLEVIPELGSTLALDDEFKRSSAEKLYLVASADPVLWNKREAAQQLASTFRARDAEKLLNPEMPPSPRVPETRVSISLALKWDDLPGEVQNEILQKTGLSPSADLDARDALKSVERLNQAAKAAQELTEPGVPASEVKGGPGAG